MTETFDIETTFSEDQQKEIIELLELLGPYSKEDSEILIVEENVSISSKVLKSIEKKYSNISFIKT